MAAPEILAYLSLIMPISMIIVMFVFAQISQKQGKVARRPPLYRWFYVSSGLLMVALVYRIWAQLSFGSLIGDAVALYDLPVMLALLLAVVIAWQYWGWLLGERGNRGNRPEH